MAVSANSAVRVRLYPTPELEQYLNRLFAGTRKVWNVSLGLRSAAWKDHGQSMTGVDVSRLLPEWKTSEELGWLADLPAVPLQQVLRNQDQAFKNFFDSHSGKRKGPLVRYPRFKTRNHRQSARFTKGAFRVLDNGRLVLAKAPEALVARWSTPIPAHNTVTSVTVSKDPAGRFFASLQIETAFAPLPVTGQSVGVDLGVKTLAVTSDGQEFGNPKHLRRREWRLARYQRVMARRKPKPGQVASRNYRKAQRRVAGQHVKVADARRDYLHKTTTELIRRYDVIVLEDLNVSGMVKNHCLAKAISDASFGEFRRQIEYKAAWYGRRVVIINRFHPSSRLCSDCGWKNSQLKLSDREWVCLDCGTLHDRDLNAAKNILAAGQAVIRRELDEACGEVVRPKTSVRLKPRKGRQTSVKQEPTEKAANAA